MKFCYMTFTLEIRRILERKSLPTKNDKLFFVTLPPHFTAKKKSSKQITGKWPYVFCFCTFGSRCLQNGLTGNQYCRFLCEFHRKCQSP